MKFYSLSIGAIIVGLIVLGMGILYLSHALKIKNIENKDTRYLVPNITYLTLAVMWILLGIYLAVIVKIQLV